MAYVEIPLTPQRPQQKSPKLPSSKKRRMSHVEIPSILQRPRPSKETTTTESLPHVIQGAPAVYCHQCNRKQATSAILQCTFKVSHTAAKGKVTTERRCGIKLCKACLKNRYAEDLDQIRNAPKPTRLENHVPDEDYTFKCPKCRDICNCRGCRKAKGLEPLGKFSLTTDEANPPVARESKPLPKKKADGSASEKIEAPAPHVKPRAPRKPRVKPLPEVNWTPLPVDLSLDIALARMQIREFIFRFAPIMGATIAKVHLDELATIASSEETGADKGDLIGWVSEPCVKAVAMALLSLLSQEASEDEAKAIKTAIKDIRSTGANLNKLWRNLSILRGDAAGEGMLFSFPDPLPPPASIHLPATRTMRSHDASTPESIPVLASAQLVPVLVGLIATALTTKAIRAEIEDGIKDGKDTTREAREAIKRENERWDIQRKEIEEIKDPEIQAEKLKLGRNLHKQDVHALEMALKVAMNAFVPRFMPLGQDNNGRTYWVLSPGTYDQDYAFDLINARASDGGKMKLPKRAKKHVKNEEERGALKDWSWFLAVWGMKPSTTTKATSEDREDEEESGERWWVFWEPAEIKKLAQWISMTSNLDARSDAGGDTPSTSSSSHKNGDDSPAKNRLQSLVKDLDDYAALLDWRITAGIDLKDNVAGK